MEKAGNILELYTYMAATAINRDNPDYFNSFKNRIKDITKAP